MTQQLVVYYYLSLFPNGQLISMTEQQLRLMCFQGLDNKTWGYGDKR